MSELSNLWVWTLACVMALAVGGAGSASGEAAELSGWKPYLMRQGDGQGGWILKPAEYQCLGQSFWGPSKDDWKAFGLVQMDNGEVVVVGTGKSEEDGEDTVIAFSSDRGGTWSEFESIPDITGRPMMLAYLGGGNLTFVTGQRHFSSDYGRTWSESVEVPLASNGGVWGTEGNPLVERDAQGTVTRMAEVGWNMGPPDDKVNYPEEPENAFMRWSDDGGRTWRDEIRPQEWRWQETYEGKTYTRGVSEGSLVRAANGWLVAALRTDMPARYLNVPHEDHAEGTGVSISQDDGRTWSPVHENTLYDAGRMHANLLRMPNGDLVMTVTVRQDVRGGKLASYQRGCEAIISHDNGLTWDLESKYILEEWQFLDRDQPHIGPCGHLYSVLLDDGAILTAHNNYLSKGISLIRWRP